MHVKCAGLWLRVQSGVGSAAGHIAAWLSLDEVIFAAVLHAVIGQLCDQ